LRRVLNTIFAALLVTSALAAAPEAKGQAEAPDTLMPWKVVNFAVLAVALGYLIYKKGGPFFAARGEGIRRGLEDAAKANREATARYAEMERRLANLGAEIEKLKERACQESGGEVERMRAQTARELQKISEQTEQDVGALAKAARQELRTYAAELAVSLAEKRIRERLTPDSEKALLGGMLRDLDRRSDAQPSGVS